MAAYLRPGTEVDLNEPTGSASLEGHEKEPLVIIAERSGLASALSMIDMLGESADSPPTFILLRGCGSDTLERMTMEHARRARLEAHLLANESMLEAALEKTMHSAAAQVASADKKARVIVKAGTETTKLAREILFRHGVRPWNIQADNVTD
jgi:ferredoxin-NADP reductase